MQRLPNISYRLHPPKTFKGAADVAHVVVCEPGHWYSPFQSCHQVECTGGSSGEERCLCFCLYLNRKVDLGALNCICEAPGLGETKKATMSSKWDFKIPISGACPSYTPPSRNLWPSPDPLCLAPTFSRLRAPFRFSEQILLSPGFLSITYMCELKPDFGN